MTAHILSFREQQVLEAVIQSYVDTAEPAGSRTIAKKYQLGVSAATIRNTMSDLEAMGYLYHPHTSAGRVPTDLAYRVYVDRLMNPPTLNPTDRTTIAQQLSGETAIEGLLEKAAQVLGVVSKELGFSFSVSFDQAVLEQLQLVPVSSERLLMILVLRAGIARTMFVEVASGLPQEAVEKVARVLNERLSGLTLKEIRNTLADRVRDSATGASGELINIFVEEAEELFSGVSVDDSAMSMSSAQMLADQPEFSTRQKMQDLLSLTERRDVLQEALRQRPGAGLTVTIGAENVDPTLSGFTLVTGTYDVDGLSGVIGVMGPTRMPYAKVIALVEHASRLIGGLR
jgi:heat-inducible transcriptional repressor